MQKRQKKVSIQARRRLFFSRPLCLFLVFFVIIALISNFISLYNLENEKKQKEDEYITLQEESEFLKNEITKLNDPEYLAKFARENYSYSKDGEVIIKIDDGGKEEIKIENQIKSNTNEIFTYVIIGISLFLFYIFICIIRRKKSE